MRLRRWQKVKTVSLFLFMFFFPSSVFFSVQWTRQLMYFGFQTDQIKQTVWQLKCDTFLVSVQFSIYVECFNSDHRHLCVCVWGRRKDCVLFTEPHLRGWEREGGDTWIKHQGCLLWMNQVLINSAHVTEFTCVTSCDELALIFGEFSVLIAGKGVCECVWKKYECSIKNV